MALYSWFIKNTNEPNKKSVRVNNSLLKASESIRYLENYTMWPTAKIKQGIDVTLPVHDDVKNKIAKQSTKPKAKLSAKHMPLETVLIANK